MNSTRTVIPAFLRECADYDAYISRGLLGTLQLPEYLMDAAGNAFVNRGEVFCRVLSCERRTVPLSSTTNLRAHLLGHGINCEATPSGRVSQAIKTATMQWYAALIVASGPEKEENEEEVEEEVKMEEAEAEEEEVEVKVEEV